MRLYNLAVLLLQRPDLAQHVHHFTLRTTAYRDHNGRPQAIDAAPEAAGEVNEVLQPAVRKAS